MKSLNPCKKKDYLKEIEGISPENLMNDFIWDKLKEIVNLQDIVKKDDVHHKWKRRKFHDFNQYYFAIVFLRYMYTYIKDIDH